MEQLKDPKNLDKIAKAISKVIKSVKGIDKDMTVGSGSFQYKGVSDKEVKSMFNKLMGENGLSMLPIDVKADTSISQWQETVEYGGKVTVKQKQSIFTEVETKYLLLHDSGQNIVLAGYGQGVDSGDKGAGKATTYAMKYTLLYTFLVATGKIDDSDNTHSEEIEKPKQQKTPSKATSAKKKDMTDEVYKKAVKSTNVDSLKKALTTYNLTNDQLKGITARLEELNKGK